MMDDRVAINYLDNGIADVRLVRADKMNALDPAMFQAIIAACNELSVRPGLRAVVLSGEGRSFCAGLDMASMAATGSGNASRGSASGGNANPGQASTGQSNALIDRTHGNANDFQAVAMLWRRLTVPVIAAVHGVCFGGGLQIASGADFRVMAPDARLAVMEMKWGLIPDMGGYALWRGMVRDDVLRALTYSNREFSGSEALELGFATEINADPRARALELANEIAGKNPDAIREAKALFNEYADMDEDAILMAESVRQMNVIRKPNQIEAVMAAMQKRLPVFK